MELFNLLDTGVTVFGQTFDVSLNWIGKLIRWLCNGVGVVGVGIILFSLILKLITLPFDIYQRISMRKQNIQMKANQEQMEKLQKQYANDKEKYNQKVMEMYKANGISVFSSCLPMILSLVIFIVAINAFNAYAQYSNVENYNTLVDAYNASITRYCTDLTEDNYATLVSEVEETEGNITLTVKDTAEDKFVFYTLSVKAEEYTALTIAEKIDYIHTFPTKSYYVDEEQAVKDDSEIAKYVAEHTDMKVGEAVSDYLEEQAQDAVVVAYEEKVKTSTSFGWMKNIWVTDASYKHPVLNAQDFANEAKQEKFYVDGKKIEYDDMAQYTNVYGETAYNEVTAKLSAQKSAANGYFILIALSIGTILLQQFIMQRSQKEQQKFSSVDGMGGSQQKIMMFVMTGMFAIFSFMYSSAFSIYLITSNLFSLLSMLLINKLVDKAMEKKEEVASVEKYKNHAADRIEKAKNAGRAAAQESRKKNK